MAELGFPARTALGALHPRADRWGDWHLTERFDVALATLACRRGQAGAVATRAAGIGLPLPPPGRSAIAGDWGALWLSPEMWLVEAPLAARPNLRATLRTHFGAAASITDQTDGWVRFDLTGPHLPRLFERLTNADLAAAPDGFATRTQIEHIGCLLALRGGTVTLYAGRSLAGSLHHALATAAISAG